MGNRLRFTYGIVAVSAVATLLAASVAFAASCREEAGAAKAAEYVRECLDFSPATHPPCNASNPCALIIGEIQCGCGTLGADTPRYCADYNPQ